jgi:hypothetical protein
MPDKGFEYWAALIGAALYVGARDAEKAPVRRRLVKILSSGLLAYATSEALAQLTGWPEVLIAVGVMSLGQLLLDLASGVIQDRDFITGLVRTRLGGRGRD